MQLAGPAGQMLNVSASVDAATGAWDLRLDGKGIDIGAMLARFGHPGMVTGGSTDLALQLRGRGKTLHGAARLARRRCARGGGPAAPAQLRHRFRPRDRWARSEPANPSHKTDPDTDVKCFVARVPISNGVLTSDRGIAAETTKYNVVLNGTLDLRTEAIDLAVTPVVKGGLGVGAATIAPIVRVGGTLGTPTLAVDPVGVAKSAVGAGVAVVATPWWLADAVLRKSEIGSESVRDSTRQDGAACESSVCSIQR